MNIHGNPDNSEMAVFKADRRRINVYMMTLTANDTAFLFSRWSAIDNGPLAEQERLHVG